MSDDKKLTPEEIVEGLKDNPEAILAYVTEAEAGKSALATTQELLDEATAELEKSKPAPKGPQELKAGKKTYELPIPTFKVPGHAGRVFNISDLEANTVEVIVTGKEDGKKHAVKLVDFAISTGVIIEKGGES